MKLIGSGVVQSLQRLTEMNEFIDFITNSSKTLLTVQIISSTLGNFKSREPLEDLLKKWQKRVLHTKLDPIPHWDDIITNRFQYKNLFIFY